MIIKTEKLVKRYGELTALDHVSLNVTQGEIFGLLGPNGSGKTTAINCILGLLDYQEGNIEVFGKKMTPHSYDSKQRIGVVPQEIALFETLSVQENIDYFCGLYIKDRRKRKAMVEEAISFTGLEKFKSFKPKKLSGGLKRRLNIACGIAHGPNLIFLDEPTVAVDPQSRNRILEGILDLNKQGATIIYTSHYMEEVEQICSRIMILDKGREVASGTRETLKSLIDMGEKTTIEVFDLQEEQLSRIREIHGVASVQYENNLLLTTSHRGSQILEILLKHLKQAGIHYGRIWSNQPTLNDVFLEITGKELRDSMESGNINPEQQQLTTEGMI